uniref:Uncharacterized protein LOC104236079 n=1 Tax=Nicotiana sylvestris TaxID=4096 RepID=A0A1U7XMR9_NICSY|nr:PREDICTED: uncharacterized protein LOC104236079 [Nicotiana sylvestris]
MRSALVQRDCVTILRGLRCLDLEKDFSCDLINAERDSLCAVRGTSSAALLPCARAAVTGSAAVCVCLKTMVKQRGRGAKQPGRGPAPAVSASHTAQASQYVPSESSDGSAVGSGEYSTSLTASVSGESAEGGTNSDNEVPDSGVPQFEGSDNPKYKNYKPLVSTPAGQFEEPVAVESSIEPSTKPSTMPAATTIDDLPPGPSASTGHSTSADPGVPSSRTHPFTTHQLSRKLAIEAHSAPSSAQIPQSIEDILKKLLDNQEKIMKTQDALTKAVDSHGKALRELAK